MVPYANIINSFKSTLIVVQMLKPVFCSSGNGVPKKLENTYLVIMHF
jgi:hypothetical protein